MIEKLVNSKTRLKILKLFLSHIDDRYYLRELERLLGESLSPLRRQLVKLTNIGILITEEEANLKYYKLNKDFEGLEELRELVLESRNHAEAGLRPDAELTRKEEQGIIEPNDIYVGNGFKPFPTKQFRYDLAVLSFISIFVLITAVFVVYSNTKNIKQVARMMAVEPGKASFAATPRAWAPQGGAATDAGNGEMASKRWKVFSGNIPVLSDVETGGGNSKEL
ncbi:MAG: hypothetical protein COW10_05875 [Candidatus Omnitrophica bacterium CG12_big_fil_rev_8_21_14_0_65_42_8]|nr:MAG: hypothetical protein COW10_05875 [Candidatus Omnitrophica bacterium CG12_big_fil_rev_8_21_14_0_65_42_8]